MAADASYVSRGGIKLEAALDAFDLDPTGWTCTDLGANVGGFTDCLLQCGAGRVFAVDTGYGTLAWKLRQDPRVTVMERSNALHVEPAAPCDLVVVDLGWTRQRYAIPAALRWLAPQARGSEGGIVTLIKPHYETERRGILEDAEALAVRDRTLESMSQWGARVVDWIESPIRGGGRRGKGNREWLALLRPDVGPAEH